MTYSFLIKGSKLSYLCQFSLELKNAYLPSFPLKPHPSIRLWSEHHAWLFQRQMSPFHTSLAQPPATPRSWSVKRTLWPAEQLLHRDNSLEWVVQTLGMSMLFRRHVDVALSYRQ